ncbi:MAG: amino acid permease [Solirubrobacteraceae bacterium]
MSVQTDTRFVNRDSLLDAGSEGDDEYLEQLGYKPELKRALGVFSNFCLQFGQIAPIGGIVFTLSVGLVAVGPATMWTWVIAGALQVVVAWCVAEACSAYPVAGASYNIVSRLAGRFAGWQTGWWIEIAHIVSVSGSCVAIAPIIVGWFGVSSLSHWQTVGVVAVLILLSTLINILSVKLSSSFVNVGVIATLAACVLVVVGVGAELLFGSHHVNSGHYLFTTQGTVHGSYVLPLLYAALLPAIVINGFDVSGNASEETKDAQHAVPRAMVFANAGSYLFGTIVILLLLLALTSFSKTLAAPQPVTFILNPVLGHPLAKTFEVLAVYGLYVSAVVLQMAGARVIWAQARDGEFPAARLLSRLNRDKVPANGVWLAGIIAFLLVLWSSLYSVLIAMTVVLWLAGYGLLIGSLTVAKLRGRAARAAFRVRGWVLVFPLAVVWCALLSFVLIYQNPKHVGIGLAIVVAAGILIYFFALPKGREAHDLASQHAAGLTVADALQMEVLRRGDARVATGNTGLDRIVRWVHTGEIADIAGYLRGGELLLTAGLGLGETAEEQRRYISSLAEAGVAGLVVELAGRAFSEFPPAALEEAERCGIPVITLRREVPFVEVSRQMNERILRVQDGDAGAAGSAGYVPQAST